MPDDELRRAVAVNQLVLLPVELALSEGERALHAGGGGRSAPASSWRSSSGSTGRWAGRARSRARACSTASDVRQAAERAADPGGRPAGRRASSRSPACWAWERPTSRPRWPPSSASAFLRAGDTEYDLSARYAEETRELLPAARAGPRSCAAHCTSAPCMRQVAVGESERASGRLPGAAELDGGVRRPHRLHPPRRERGRLASSARWRSASRSWPPTSRSRRCGWSRPSATP